MGTKKEVEGITLRRFFSFINAKHKLHIIQEVEAEEISIHNPRYIYDRTLVIETTSEGNPVRPIDLETLESYVTCVYPLKDELYIHLHSKITSDPFSGEFYPDDKTTLGTEGDDSDDLF